MRKIGILATVVICCVAVLGGAVYLTNDSGKKKKTITLEDKAAEEAYIHRANQLLYQGRVEDALKIIHAHEGQINVKTELGRQWLDLLIESCVKTANYSQLIILYETYPQAFKNNEKASLVVANGYILSKNAQLYRELRDTWADRGVEKETWLVLDADAFLLEGKKQEALKLLQSTKFSGKKETDRLVRLSLLYVIDNPKMAWDYLAEAHHLDPQNSDILTYRGKLLESLGKHSLALHEYLAAIQAAPDNLFWRDQLAEFYMRQNQPTQALSVWLETLSKPSLDSIWLKVLFWSKVLTPINFDWSKTLPPTGTYKPFIDYILALPQGTFWDEEAFSKLPNGHVYLNELQVSFWLRLLEALKQGNESEARGLLKFNTFTKSLLNPQLEKAVKHIIAYRTIGSLNFEANLFNQTTERPAKEESAAKNFSEGREAFFAELDYYANKELIDDVGPKLPLEISELITSKEAFTAAFLAAGWQEAAIALHKMPVLPAVFPDWVAYSLTESLQSNRSSAEALAFAVKQKKTAPLSLLIGELYIVENRPNEALAILKPYVQDQNEIGYRAALLSSAIYVDNHEYAKAKESIESQPKFAEELAGREALARIALAEGNTELADHLYRMLQDESPEAMSYLARKAYAEKNWVQARELTEQLLLMFPDSPILRDNLNKIIEEQNVQKHP